MQGRNNDRPRYAGCISHRGGPEADARPCCGNGGLRYNCDGGLAPFGFLLSRQPGESMDTSRASNLQMKVNKRSVGRTNLRSKID